MKTVWQLTDFKFVTKIHFYKYKVYEKRFHLKRKQKICYTKNKTSKSCANYEKLHSVQHISNVFNVTV